MVRDKWPDKPANKNTYIFEGNARMYLVNEYCKIIFDSLNLKEMSNQGQVISLGIL
jgi:hypothetical protein